jgi:hypothetical protein
MMMRTSIGIGRAACITTALVVLTAGGASRASAAALLVNGGFESGFTGWTRVNALGSDGTFALQSGTTSPVSGVAVPAPPQGSVAAMTDALGPGGHVLYQDFVVPVSLSSAILEFDLFVGNRANAFYTPATPTLDFGSPALNQQARVDILRGGADPFSVAAADVLLNIFQTQPGNPLVSGYNTISTNVTALLLANLGQTLRLRFAETDNVFTFQLGVDDVSLDTDVATPIPEPTTLLLVGSAMLGIAARSRRPRRSRHLRA